MIANIVYVNHILILCYLQPCGMQLIMLSQTQGLLAAISISDSVCGEGYRLKVRNVSIHSVKQLILKELQTIRCQNTHILALLNIWVKACIAGVGREQIWCQIWIQHVEKPPCANFWSNRGNQWRLTAYCNFCLMTRASDFQFKLH